eukprot:826374-Pyramimonas_sp.AAC.1
MCQNRWKKLHTKLGIRTFQLHGIIAFAIRHGLLDEPFDFISHGPLPDARFTSVLAKNEQHHGRSAVETDATSQQLATHRVVNAKLVHVIQRTLLGRHVLEAYCIHLFACLIHLMDNISVSPPSSS